MEEPAKETEKEKRQVSVESICTLDCKLCEDRNHMCLFNVISFSSFSFVGSNNRY